MVGRRTEIFGTQMDQNPNLGRDNDCSIVVSVRFRDVATCSANTANTSVIQADVYAILHKRKNFDLKSSNENLGINKLVGQFLSCRFQRSKKKAKSMMIWECR